MAESFGGHIERLLQGAAQAAANGRMAEAEALFAKAEAKRPNIPWC
jgi:hypothetical protein